MKITIYTINDCPFCKSEKEYLASHNLPFEEKNVEQNREFLAEMLEVSNKFAGVPFTMVVKDDGTKEGIKGFTKEEFDKVLGFAEKGTQEATTQPMQAAPADTTVPVPASTPSVTDTPVVNTPPAMPAEPAVQVVEPPVAQMPEPAPMQPAVPPPSAAPMATDTPTTPQSPQLDSVLNNLQAMAGGAPASTEPVVAEPTPQIPTPPSSTEPSSTVDQGAAPVIPDLPKDV